MRLSTSWRASACALGLFQSPNPSAIESVGQLAAVGACTKWSSRRRCPRSRSSVSALPSLGSAHAVDRGQCGNVGGVSAGCVSIVPSGQRRVLVFAVRSLRSTVPLGHSVTMTSGSSGAAQMHGLPCWKHVSRLSSTAGIGVVSLVSGFVVTGRFSHVSCALLGWLPIRGAGSRVPIEAAADGLVPVLPGSPGSRSFSSSCAPLGHFRAPVSHLARGRRYAFGSAGETFGSLSRLQGRPAKITVSNSRPLAACSVDRVTHCPFCSCSCAAARISSHCRTNPWAISSFGGSPSTACERCSSANCCASAISSSMLSSLSSRRLSSFCSSAFL